MTTCTVVLVVGDEDDDDDTDDNDYDDDDNEDGDNYDGENNNGVIDTKRLCLRSAISKP